MSARKTIGIIGGSVADSQTIELAYEVGKHIATNNAVVVCGGKGGVMEAVSRGASENGGLVIGILPSGNKNDANPYVDIAIPTNMGVARNVLVVQSSDSLIAFPGSYGTLSEMGIALNIGKSVIYLPGAWDLKKIGRVDTSIFKEAFNASHAVGLALDFTA